MVVVPEEIPVTTPPVETVPTAVLVLVHVPPAVPLALSVVVVPTQTVAVPLMVPGVASGLTVTTCVAKQPSLSVYVIVAVPPLTPVINPVPDPTLATPEVPEVHVPPDGDELKVVVSPAQILVVPVIVPGAVFTVIVTTALHPVPRE
jgi:hypothetical protein